MYFSFYLIKPNRITYRTGSNSAHKFFFYLNWIGLCTESTKVFYIYYFFFFLIEQNQIIPVASFFLYLNGTNYTYKLYFYILLFEPNRPTVLYISIFICYFLCLIQTITSLSSFFLFEPNYRLFLFFGLLYFFTFSSSLSYYFFFV